MGGHGIPDPKNVKAIANRQAQSSGETRFHHPYIAFVKDNTDLQRMGRMRVWIPDFSGEETDESQWHLVQYASPFAGATNIRETGENLNEGQTTYGFWFPPPDINNQVIIIFINGDPTRGVAIAALYDTLMNYMVPGLPGAKIQPRPGVEKYGIASEYNKSTPGVNPDQPLRPPFAMLQDQLEKQGLDNDFVRGINTSSARRAPSDSARPGGQSVSTEVFGIKTPKGYQFFFDETEDEDFFRIRTPRGAQIMLNDKHGNIYIITRDGNSWLEMSADGQIDLFSEANVSIHAKKDFNIRADENINFEAGKNIHMKALENDIRMEAKLDIHIKADRHIHGESVKDINLTSGANTLVLVGGSHNTLVRANIQESADGTISSSAGGSYNVTAGGTYAEDAEVIHMNSGAATVASPQTAKKAELPPVHELRDNIEVEESIDTIVPEHEPWKPHELPGNTLSDERGQANLQKPKSNFIDPRDAPATQLSLPGGGPGGGSPFEPANLLKPFTELPLSQALRAPSHVPFKQGNCTDVKPISQHTLSDTGARHMLQNTPYIPYAQTLSNSTRKTIGYGSPEQFGIDWFTRFPEGITEPEALSVAKSGFFNSTLNTKTLFGENDVNVSQQQFDSLVSLTHFGGAANISKYTNIPQSLSKGRLEETGISINQLVPQVSALSDMLNSPATLFNQCDYGTPISPTQLQSDGLRDAFNNYSDLSIAQKQQVAGVSAKTGDLNTLSAQNPQDAIVRQTAQAAQNDFAGFKKHEFYEASTVDPLDFEEIIVVDPTLDLFNLSPTLTSASGVTSLDAKVEEDLSGCDDLIEFEGDFPASFQLTENYSLADFTKTGSINGTLAVSKTAVVCNLRSLAENILEPMIASGIEKQNITIISALRNGKSNAPHFKGQSIDFRIDNIGVSLIDVAIYLEKNLTEVFDEAVLMNCNPLGAIHIMYVRENDEHKSIRKWKPALDKNVYLPIEENNQTYGGGWDSFESMKNNPGRSKNSEQCESPLDWALGVC